MIPGSAGSAPTASGPKIDDQMGLGEEDWKVLLSVAKVKMVRGGYHIIDTNQALPAVSAPRSFPLPALS